MILKKSLKASAADHHFMKVCAAMTGKKVEELLTEAVALLSRKYSKLNISPSEKDQPA